MLGLTKADIIFCLLEMLLFVLPCRVLNAFLNTGDGGTVYMGVVDEGHVLGLNFTQYRVSFQYSNHYITCAKN